MAASCTRTAIYRVTFHWPAKAEEGAFLDLSSGVHPDSPLLSVKDPYVGPLCACELALLRGEVQDKSLSTQWSFDIEKLAGI